MTFPTLQHMALTDRQIRLVQKSWRLLRDIDPQVVGDLFYSKLFLDHPEVRAMFPKDLKMQHQKLLDMISKVVARLDHLGDMNGEIKEMGKRHEGYGVLPHHYGWVGSALLWTIKNGMNKEWSPELEEAWTVCYTNLVELMLEA
ncbi:MAG: hemoglobin [Lewinellaceae bacterium]|nr:hemoglobin [Lewinellaceae bacterium]